MKMSDERLNEIKREARKWGNSSSEKYVEVISRFWEKYNLKVYSEYGKLWEIVAFFILGVMQTSMKKRGIYFWINTETELDKIQIDVEINRHPIQLKFDWSDAALDITRDILAARGISLINARMEDDGIDIFREILEAAGFSQADIDEEVFNNEGFDAAYEVYEWFVKGLV